MLILIEYQVKAKEKREKWKMKKCKNECEKNK